MSLFMMILHGNENKVYGGREMDREIDLNNFIHARLYGYFKRNDNKQKFISLLNPLILPKNVLLFSHFLIRKIPRIWWQAKWETIWIYFSAIFFFKLYICMLKLWTWYNGWPHNGMQCMFVPRRELIHMICKIVMNLLLYTRKGEGKGRK